MLVALAAIDELAPGWIDDPQSFALVTKNRSVLVDPNEIALAEAIRKHTQGGNSWENLTHYRRAYLRLCSELDHAKSPAARAAATV
jgi:hypothetical protein